MTRQIRSLAATTAAALAFAFFAGLSMNAEAAFMAYICEFSDCSGPNVMIVTDNMPGDLNPLPGVIQETFTFGGFTVTTNTAFSKPEVGDATSPVLDINFSASGTGTVYMYASDTDFTGVVSMMTGTVDGNSTGGNPNIEVGVFGANNNINPVAGGTPGPTLCVSPVVSGTPFHTGCTTGPIGTSPNPYQLTIGLFIQNTSKGLTTGDFDTHVPEPGTLLLVGLGLLGMAGGMRRRRTD